MNIFNNKNTDLDTENKLMITCREKEEDRARQDRETLFETQTNAIANEVFRYPLREMAKSALGKMFARGESADDIIRLVEEYYLSGELCAVRTEEIGSPAPDTARIICSLGLRRA